MVLQSVRRGDTCSRNMDISQYVLYSGVRVCECMCVVCVSHTVSCNVTGQAYLDNLIVVDLCHSATHTCTNTHGIHMDKERDRWKKRKRGGRKDGRKRRKEGGREREEEDIRESGGRV